MFLRCLRVCLFFKIFRLKGSVYLTFFRTLRPFILHNINYVDNCRIRQKARFSARKGRGLMWYVVQALGGEDVEKVCDKCRTAMPEGVAREIFVPKYICLKHFKREWHEKLLPLFPDYFFMDTGQPEEVRERLRPLSRIMKPVCVGEDFVPIYPEEQKFLEEMMDGRHVIRKSTGNLVDGKFEIYEGPLRDVEKHGMIRKVDRHRRLADLEVRLLGEARQVQVTLEIVKKINTAAIGVPVLGGMER